jgi:hypothetical protein
MKTIRKTQRKSIQGAYICLGKFSEKAFKAPLTVSDIFPNPIINDRKTVSKTLLCGSGSSFSSKITANLDAGT